MSGWATRRPARVEHEGVARLTDMDRRDHVPDQLEIDLRDGDAVDLARTGNCHGHVRLGTFVQCHRAVPGVIRAGADDGGIARAINAAVDNVGVDPRDLQPFDALVIDQRDRDDRRHLPQQPQYVEPVPLVGPFPPRQLHGPLQLVGDIAEISLDLARGRTRFGVQPLGQYQALIAITELRLARSVGEQRHDDSAEQCGKIFSEQRALRG
jgi:hypothetical protein